MRGEGTRDWALNDGGERVLDWGGDDYRWLGT